MAITQTDDQEMARVATAYLPTFENVEEERRHRKERLAAGFRLFA